MAKKGFRKPQSRKQGLKILAYGENGAGKSLFSLSFPDAAFIDSESKVGVYEEEYQDNIVGLADTAHYYEVIDLMENVVNDPSTYRTLVIDSGTSIHNALSVAAMEQEEARARKKGGNIDDQTISMRGYGKIKLNNTRFNQYIAQASANGTTVIVTAHKDDVFTGTDSNKVKIGEKPVLQKNSGHTFDVILRHYKEKDMVTGKTKFLVEVEKDTTKTYEIGTVLEKASYENFKDYIEKSNGKEVVKTSYDKTINDNIDHMDKEQESHDQLVENFKKLYADAIKKDPSNKDVIAGVMKEKNAVKYNDASKSKELKEVIEFIKDLA